MPILSHRPWDRSGSLSEARALIPADFRQFTRNLELTSPAPSVSASTHNGIFVTCANPGCSSGWLKLFRPRTAPVFESGWCCSEACVRVMVDSALLREMDARTSEGEAHHHRIPLGLAMLGQGWITGSQLRGAIAAQKAARGGRLGYWLVRSQGVSEQLVTRALGIQWSCPVLSAEFQDVEGLAALVPRLFVDAFGALPLRTAAGRILYLGFEDRLDPALAFGLERMTGFRVECGLVAGSTFRPAHAAMLKAAFPAVELMEATSEAALAQALAGTLERARPVESRLVRIHDCFWLRMWVRPQTGSLPAASDVRDVIASSRSH